jgi:proteic killer suppression protein
MIRSFKDSEAEAIFDGRRSTRLPPGIQPTAQRKLMMLDAATSPNDLRTPPGNHLEALHGREGVFSIRINRQWRITFSWNDGAEDVRIEDYH